MFAFEEVISKVGLPVKCHTCETKAFLKVGGGKDGWYHWTPLRGVSKWYCPEHIKDFERTKNHFEQKFQTPKPKINVKDELYALID